jgi:hypothetical protein
MSRRGSRPACELGDEWACARYPTLHPGYHHATDAEVDPLVDLVSEEPITVDTDGDDVLKIEMNSEYDSASKRYKVYYRRTGRGGSDNWYTCQADYLLLPDAPPVTEEDIAATIASIRESIQTHVHTNPLRGGEQ